MPAIAVSNLSWSLPDARPLFSDLNLTFTAERAGLVGRNGVGKTTLLKLIAGELAPASGDINVTGRIAVLRQSVQVAPDETIADLFGVRDALAVLKRAEEGAASAHDLGSADWTLETRMASALGRVGLNAGANTPLASLSGGQRTRAALAALVFGEPDFLLLDEPTNNLDREGRAAVVDLLANWRAGAIVVSHDRELLETMDAIVEMTTLGAKRYGGNWSAYRARKATELAAAEHDLANAEKRIADVERSAQQTSERKARKDRAGRAKAMKGDMPAIMIGGLKENAENTSGESARLAERRRADALESAQEARERVEVLQSLKLSLPQVDLPAGKVVLQVESVTAGYEEGRPVLRDFSLSVVGPERIAITGPNGSGKTTLLSLITGEMQPWSGAARALTDFALFDQDVSLLDSTLSVLDNFKRLNPEADENACRAALARFMFRADAAHQIAGTLSGGQLLRAGLACVLGGASPPPLLILDEPTNHLDLSSIEAIESALSGYDGSLLIVSHDEAFLDAIGITRRVEL